MTLEECRELVGQAVTLKQYCHKVTIQAVTTKKVRVSRNIKVGLSGSTPKTVSELVKPDQLNLWDEQKANGFMVIKQGLGVRPGVACASLLTYRSGEITLKRGSSLHKGWLR